MRDLDLSTLRLFVSVCESGSMARAAQQHHLVASAVSKRLAQLEAQLGHAVLERGSKGLVATGAGEILLAHARSLLAGADRVARDMAAFARGITGQVRILATVSSVAQFLPDDVAAFLQRPEHSDIRVDIEEALSRDVVAGLREGLAPIGVCWDHADLEGLHRLAYRCDRLAVIATTGHPLARLSSCRFAQTLGYEQVGLPANTAVHTLLRRAAALAGRPISYRAVVSTFDAALRCVRADLGIAVVPAEVAQPVAAAYGLRVILLTDPWATRRFVVCFPAENRLSPAASALAEHLHAVASEGG